jgi:hypothetical protein
MSDGPKHAEHGGFNFGKMHITNLLRVMIQASLFTRQPFFQLIDLENYVFYSCHFVLHVFAL